MCFCAHKMDLLPTELVLALKLDAPSLAALACTSTRMHDLVSAVRCVQGVRVKEAHVHVLTHERYSELTSLHVAGAVVPYTTAPTPVPVPRPMPRLHTLHMRLGCLPPGFWDAILARAPALSTLVLRPIFFTANYAAVIEACGETMRCASRLQHLTRLEMRGDGMVAWGNAWYSHDSLIGRAVAAARRVHAAPAVSLPALTKLVVTGQQFVPAVDAPLEELVVEEPTCLDLRMVDRLSERSRRTLRSLRWLVPVHHTMAMPALPSLRTLDMTIRSIRCATAFSRATESLARLPDTLTSLALKFEFPTIHDDGALSYAVTPLAHLATLETLAITVTFPTPGCEALVRGLLGCASTRLRAVTLQALRGAAEGWRAVLDGMLVDEQADPDSEEVLQLEREISELEQACCVPREAVWQLNERHPGARCIVRGFPIAHHP